MRFQKILLSTPNGLQYSAKRNTIAVTEMIILTRFFESVITKFINGIKQLAKEGVTKLLEGLGLEITGTVSFSTPEW